MKWIMEHISPAALVVIVSLLLAALCTALLAVDGPVQDFVQGLFDKLMTGFV